MPEHLTLVTQKQIRRFRNDTYVGNHVSWPVCAVERENGTTISARPEYVPLTDRAFIRVPLALGSRAAERFVEFYGNAFREGFRDYDCYTFAVDITTGRKLEPNEWVFASHDLGRDAHPNDLDQGIAYSLTDEYDNGRHAVIGSSKPMMSISVMGTGSQLFHMTNHTLQEIYSPRYIREITSKQTGRVLSAQDEV